MSEGRTNLLFVVLLLGQLILLTSQVRDPESGGTQLERGVLRAAAPVARTVNGALDGASWVRSRLQSRAGLRTENEGLKARVRELQLQNARFLEVQDQVERLSDALGYQPPFEGEQRLADVVHIDHSSWLRTLLIYEPGRLAVENSPVTSPEGVVGRVILRQGAYAKVQLVTDRSASVGAMIERTRRQGVVRGVGAGSLELDFVSLQADVRAGDRVVTAGIDGIYPRGLPVGTVVDVRPGEELFHRIRLRPAVDMGQLDLVYLLPPLAVPAAMREEGPDAGP